MALEGIGTDRPASEGTPPPVRILLAALAFGVAGPITTPRQERVRGSLQYLKEAAAEGDTEKLIRYVRLHLGDGNEKQGCQEIDKAWVEALKPLLDMPTTDREFILETVATKDAAMLAHLFFHLHFYLVARSGE